MGRGGRSARQRQGAKARPKARARAKEKRRHVPPTPATATTPTVGKPKRPALAGGLGRKHILEEVPLLRLPRGGGHVGEKA